MKSKYLKCNPILFASLALSIFFSALPLWAIQVRCAGIHGSDTELTVEHLQATLSKVPRDNYGLSPERWKTFQSSIDSIFPTNEKVHEFLWKFSQSIQHSMGVALANPSKGAMQALREGRPMPDPVKPFFEIELSVLSFLVRLPKSSPPPEALTKNYRALVLLAGEATPQELENLKAVFKGKAPENPSDPVWPAKFIQALDDIQTRLGHRILQ